MSVALEKLNSVNEGSIGLFHLVSAVWGEEYTNVFVDVTLPCLLAQGNIPSLPNKDICRYRIFTTEEGQGIIERSIAYRKLSRHLKVEFRTIDGSITNKHRISSDCYRIATQEAGSAGAAIIYLIPDMVFADGGIRSIVHLMRAGKRAVLAMGLRTVKETLGTQVRDKYYADGEITISPRELVSLAREHIHTITESHFYEGTSECFHPAVFCWPVGEEGFLLHSFHLQPVALLPRPSSASFVGTIDDDLLQHSGYCDREMYVVSDSDEILWFEISGASYSFPTPKRGGERDILMWMKSNTNAYHRSLFRHAIKIHAGPLSSSEWERVEACANAVVTRVVTAYDKEQHTFQNLECPRTLYERLNRFRHQIVARSQNYVDTEGVFVRQFPLSLVKWPVAWGLVALYLLLRVCVRTFRGA